MFLRWPLVWPGTCHLRIPAMATIKDDIDRGDEAYVRYHARRRGFQVVAARGRERPRREKAGLGQFMLLGAADVALFEASLADIAGFLKNHDHTRQARLH